MLRLIAFFTICCVAYAQVPAAPKPAASNAASNNDPRGRETPQSSVFHFLEACHARDYTRAAQYLDRRNMSQADRQKAPELARQLEDLLDDTPFDIATLNNDPEGNRSDDLPPNIDHLATFHVHGTTLEMQLERVDRNGATKAWLV